MSERLFLVTLRLLVRKNAGLADIRPGLGSLTRGKRPRQPGGVSSLSVGWPSGERGWSL